jgi:hypothetical protein
MGTLQGTQNLGAVEGILQGTQEESRLIRTRKRDHQKLCAGLRDEYERFPICPPSGLPTMRTYVRSPLRRGSRAETRTLGPTYVYGPTQVTYGVT